MKQLFVCWHVPDIGDRKNEKENNTSVISISNNNLF